MKLLQSGFRICFAIGVQELARLHFDSVTSMILGFLALAALWWYTDLVRRG
jgi:hypothetical protein